MAMPLTVTGVAIAGPTLGTVSFRRRHEHLFTPTTGLHRTGKLQLFDFGWSRWHRLGSRRPRCRRIIPVAEADSGCHAREHASDHRRLVAACQRHRPQGYALSVTSVAPIAGNAKVPLASPARRSPTRRLRDLHRRRQLRLHDLGWPWRHGLHHRRPQRHGTRRIAKPLLGERYSCRDQCQRSQAGRGWRQVHVFGRGIDHRHRVLQGRRVTPARILWTCGARQARGSPREPSATRVQAVGRRLRSPLRSP